MPKIFISYRWKYLSDRVIGLHEYLAKQYGDANVFLDKRDIEGGEKFATEIETFLRTADVVLVIITPEWHDEFEKRIKKKQHDYVLMEVKTALKEADLVIPIRTDKSIQFDKNCLPKELHPIVELNFMSLRGNDDFFTDRDLIKQRIDQFMNENSPDKQENLLSSAQKDEETKKTNPNSQLSHQSTYNIKWILENYLSPFIVSLFSGVILLFIGLILTDMWNSNKNDNQLLNTNTPTVTESIALTPQATSTLSSEVHSSGNNVNANSPNVDTAIIEFVYSEERLYIVPITDVNLTNIEIHGFDVNREEVERIILNDFSFDELGSSTLAEGECIRYTLADSSERGLPDECNDLHDQSLILSDDRFWYDRRNETIRGFVIIQNGEEIDTCTSTNTSCRVEINQR